MRYSAQPRDLIFVKGYESLSFAKNMAKNIGKNISKILRGEYSWKLLDYTKQSATDAFKTTSKRAIPKTAEATGDLIGNKIANKITKAPKHSQQNHSVKVADERDEEIPKRIYIYLQKKDKTRNYCWTEIKIV